MSNIRKVWSWWGFLVALLIAGYAHASTIQITVDTTSLNGTSAALAFDLIDGGLPPNSVMIFGFNSDGTLGTASLTTDFATVPAPRLTAPVTLSDSGFFNEYLQQITLGKSMSFLFNTSGGLATPTPDGFAFFILDPSATASLVSTSDPTGADALFTYSIGQDVTPDVFTSDSAHVTARVVGIPEPGALALAMAGLLALGVLRKVGKYEMQRKLIL